MMWLVELAGGWAAWLTFCKAMDVRGRTAPTSIDPCAESRAAAHELRASLAGDHR